MSNQSFTKKLECSIMADTIRKEIIENGKTEK